MSRRSDARTECGAQGLERLAAVTLEIHRREADGLPLDAPEHVAAVVVAHMGESTCVVLVAVVLDGNAMLRVGGVDPSDEATAVPDLVLEDGRRETVASQQLLELRLHDALRNTLERRASGEERSEDSDAVPPSLALPTHEGFEP